MISLSQFAATKDGKNVSKIELFLGDMKAVVLTYGATLYQLSFDNIDLILGYDTLSDYENQNGSYQGAIIGRFGNRIKGGTFSLNGTTYHVPCNEGDCHLHGGISGFDKKIWQIESISDGEEPSVTLTYTSKDGEEGYPGCVKVFVSYTLTKEVGLKITYHAETDQDTVINLTNHAYFDLCQNSCEDVSLWLNADRYLTIDEQLIPITASSLDQDEIFDFRTMKKIGKHIHFTHPQIITAKGYDHCYILNGNGFRLSAVAVGDKGVQMTMFTDRPAVQFYSGNFLKETAGRYGKPLLKRAGFCLETQGYPDAPNRADFPSCVLSPGEAFTSVTEYRFKKV